MAKKKCSIDLGEQLRQARQAAYDASRLTGNAGIYGATADFHAREAERALKGGRCVDAEKHLKDTWAAVKRAYRTPMTRKRRA